MVVALLLTGEEINKDVFIKCLAINLMAGIVGIIPVVGFLSIFVWLAAVMSFFEKNFFEALLVSVVCAVIAFGATMVLGRLMPTPSAPPAAPVPVFVRVENGSFLFIDPSGGPAITAKNVDEVLEAFGGLMFAGTPILENGVVIESRFDQCGNPDRRAAELLDFDRAISIGLRSSD